MVFYTSQIRTDTPPSIPNRSDTRHLLGPTTSPVYEPTNVSQNTHAVNDFSTLMSAERAVPSSDLSQGDQRSLSESNGEIIGDGRET